MSKADFTRQPLKSQAAGRTDGSFDYDMNAQVFFLRVVDHLALLGDWLIIDSLANLAESSKKAYGSVIESEASDLHPESARKASLRKP